MTEAGKFDERTSPTMRQFLKVSKLCTARINQANSLIEDGRYFKASSALEQAETSVYNFTRRLNTRDSGVYVPLVEILERDLFEVTRIILQNPEARIEPVCGSCM